MLRWIAFAEGLGIAALIGYLLTHEAPPAPVALPDASTAREADDEPARPDGTSDEGQVESTPAAQPGEAPSKVDAVAQAAEPGTRIVFGTLSFHPPGAGSAYVTLQNDSGTDLRQAIRETHGFAFAGLDAGTWKLTARANGYDPAEREVEVGQALATHRVDLVLQRAMTVRIALLTPEGTPLREVMDAEKIYLLASGIEVYATTDPPEESFSSRRGPPGNVSKWSTPSGWPGAEPLPKRYFGELELREAPPVHVGVYLGNTLLAAQPLEEMREEMVFTLSLDDVRGALGSAQLRLVDAVTGEPVTQARVQFGPTSGMRVDEQGVVRIENRPLGEHRLSVYAQDYAVFARQVTLEAGQPLDLGTIALDKAQTWTGAVVDPTGAPVGASIALRRVGDFVHAGGAQAKSSGAFELTGVGPADYVVVATTADDKLMAWRRIDGRTEPQHLELRMQPAFRTTLDSTLPSGTLATVRVYDTAGTQLDEISSVAGGRQRRGPVLAAGTYRLEIEPVGGEPPITSKTVSVSPDSTTIHLP